MRKDAVVTHFFEAPFQHLPGETEEMHITIRLDELAEYIMNWQGCGRKRLLHNLRLYPRICLTCLR
jgi:hypothetical protein